MLQPSHVILHTERINGVQHCDTCMLPVIAEQVTLPGPHWLVSSQGLLKFVSRATLPQC